MRLGVIILPDQPWSIARDRWRRAEEYGFEHAWTYDHIGWRDLVNGPWFDAVSTLTAAALVTSRIRLGPMVASPNLRHPVGFARSVTSVDDVSGGRVLLGVGAGGLGFDVTVFGGPELDPAQRAGRLVEFVELLDELLTTGATDPVSWRGRYYQAIEARSTPGCVQQPRVPFVIAANGPRTMRLAARFGQGWVTNGGAAEDQAGWWRTVAERVDQFDQTLARAGRDPSTMDRYLSLDPAPFFSLTSADAFADAIGRAAELGFTDAVTHWPRESGWYAGDEKVLEQVAPG